MRRNCDIDETVYFSFDRIACGARPHANAKKIKRTSTHFAEGETSFVRCQLGHAVRHCPDDCVEVGQGCKKAAVYRFSVLAGFRRRVRRELPLGSGCNDCSQLSAHSSCNE